MVEPAEVDGELRRQWPGSELREGEAFLVVLERDPAAALDEVALHVADERDRAPKARRAEMEEIDDEISKRIRTGSAEASSTTGTELMRSFFTLFRRAK